MTQEVGRRLVGGVWVTNVEDETGGGSVDAVDVAVSPTVSGQTNVQDALEALESGGSLVEEVTLSAATIAARYDGDVSAALVPAFTFAEGDVVFGYWTYETLDAGSDSGLYIDAAGRTTAQIDGESDFNLAPAAAQTAYNFNRGVSDGPPLLPTTFTAACVGYLRVDASPVSGEIVVGILVQRA